MTFWLCVFVASQLIIMLLGCLPSDWWRGKRDDATAIQVFSENCALEKLFAQLLDTLRLVT